MSHTEGATRKSSTDRYRATDQMFPVPQPCQNERGATGNSSYEVGRAGGASGRSLAGEASSVPWITRASQAEVATWQQIVAQAESGGGGSARHTQPWPTSRAP